MLLVIEVVIAAPLRQFVNRTGRSVSVNVALEKVDTFLFSITYEQFFEEVNLIRRTERSNEHSTTSGLSGLEVYEWPEATEAIIVRAVAPARYGPDVVGGQRLISAAEEGMGSSALQRVAPIVIQGE